MSGCFENGGSRLQFNDSYERRIRNTGIVGNDLSGHPLANDKKGSCFWADKDKMDPIWKYHDSRIADHELGFPEDWSTQGQYMRRIDCNELATHNKRPASGYEKGANDEFTGFVEDKAKDEYGHIIVDPQRNNEMTSGGQPECVTDPISVNDCKVSKPQMFDDPNVSATMYCNDADAISTMPEGDVKDTKLNQWNAKTEALGSRISGEQDYLQSRIADHESRMSQFPEGSLEYTRASDNRTWCQDYLNELENSKSVLQTKQNELNNSNTQTASDLPPHLPTNAPETPTVAGELPPVIQKKPQHDNSISGTTPDKAQGIALSKNELDGKSSNGLSEDAVKNSSTGFDSNNGIT